MSSNVPGNILSSAIEINPSQRVSVFTESINPLEPVDNYRFSLNARSSLNLKLSGLRADADVELIRDGNGNGIVDTGEVIAASRAPGRRNEFINQELGVGTYYIRVFSYDNIQTNYQLNVEISPVEISSGIPLAASVGGRRARRRDDWLEPVTDTNTTDTITPDSSAPPASIPVAESSISYTRVGTLGADTFTYELTTGQAVFSGNGNVDFGNGSRDTLNFRTAGISSNQVNFNWAIATGGGVAYNPGNGNRMFDAITLNNGGKILFEGIERIEFTDTTIDLTTYNVGVTNTGVGIKGTIVPNDEKFNQQWNLHMTGVHNAWRFTSGTSNILVGIQDSGLGFAADGSIHPDLRPTSWDGNNIADESTDFSHGTRVQSTISAAANNNIGIAGINWGSPLWHIDVLGGNGNDYDLARGTQTIIDNAIGQGKKVVINLSLSGGDSDAFRQLVANNQSNVLFVMAAGNGNTSSIVNPAAWAQSYGNVISVGSVWGRTDWYGNAKTPGDRINYTNWWGSNYTTDENVNAGNRPLTVMAPSEFIAATSNRNGSGQFVHSYHDRFNGTSASTAMVTGIASLVWSVNSNFTATQIKDIISQTAYDLGNPGYDRFYGHGLINADAAVRRAVALAQNYA